MNPQEPQPPDRLPVYALAGGAVHTIEILEELSGVPRRTILLYCRHGLMSPASDPDSEGWRFDDEALHALRRIERIRLASGAGLTGLKLIIELLHEVEELRAMLRLRG